MGKKSSKELIIKPNSDGVVEGGYIRPPDKVTPPKNPPPAPPPKPSEPKKTDK